MVAIPLSWIKRLVDGNFPKALVLGNHRWKRLEQKSTSWHYASDDGWLLRISDHWTEVPCDTAAAPKRVRSVGRRKIPLSTTCRCCYKGFAAGIGRHEL